MARTTATNFSGGLQFPYATAGTDLFKKEDVQTLALAVDGHDHSAGKGLVLAASAIPNGAITLARMAADSVDSSKIVDGSIATIDLANTSVTLAKLATDSVDSSKIVDGSITTADLAANAASIRGSYNTAASNQTTSTSFVGIPSMTVTADAGSMGLAAGDLLVWFTLPLYNVSGANTATIGLQVDGGAIQPVAYVSLGGAQATSVVSNVVRYVAGGYGGVHTAVLWWLTGAGTLSQQPAAMSSLVLEVCKR